MPAYEKEGTPGYRIHICRNASKQLRTTHESIPLFQKQTESTYSVVPKGAFPKLFVMRIGLC